MSSQSNQFLIEEPILISYIYKTMLQKGLLVYEYNPFRNYRCNDDIEEDGNIKYRKGSLVDFDTEDLNFNLKHPISIIPQYSYDKSVNLILNDGYNPPRIINSRFSVIGKLLYQIVDRSGNSDTNIYNQGDSFESDISLYKLINQLPELSFQGVYEGGHLSIGNYHFYFKYLDADGNATDFVAESGLVSIFIGTKPLGILSGYRDLDSLKSVKFLINNIDTSYPYVQVYYTRNTSDPNENKVTIAYKINLNYLVTNVGTCKIYINGLENKEIVDISEINNLYQIINSAETQTVCLNRLFLGNISKLEILYKDLKDLALRMIPECVADKSISDIDAEYYLSNIEESYYSPNFIYNYTGYWPEEYYRLGVVFILPNYTLSSVYNICGYLNSDINLSFEELNDVYKTDTKTNKEYRNYLEIREESGKFINELLANLNTKGVFKIKEDEGKVIGISIHINDNVLAELKKLKIQGLFFVRQTRIPNTLCQALTIATDKISNIPLIPTGNNPYTYISETFINSSKILTHDFKSRLYEQVDANINAAICPEYSLDQAYYNQIFTGNDFIIKESLMLPHKLLIHLDRHFVHSNYMNNTNSVTVNSKIIGIPSNTKLIAIDNNKYSSRAGSAELAWDFEFLGYENKLDHAYNLVRGIYNSYLGIPNITTPNKIVNIKLNNKELDLFTIRMNDNSGYFAISDRLSLKYLNNNETTCYLNNKLILYRGDCYICQYTHRINRNFNDLSAPYNDKIVDPYTFLTNVFYESGVLKQVIDANHGLSHINLGDLNAVKLGTWITFTLRSNMNLCVRSVDETNIEEKLLSGHSRGFYPLTPLSVEGEYKTNDAELYNKGFTVSLSQKVNVLLPYTPFYKNDFTNRISYSNINITDAFENGFRTFQSQNYRDYPKTYGQIIKLVEWSGNLICVFEHGVGLIPINERVVAGDGPGGNVFINTNNVLPENPLILSDLYGSLFSDSIVKTPKFVYGVDTIGKKIWRTNGNKFEIISDFKVLEFLNNNITLSEREITPIIGIRNVKTFYNAFKQDVMFTYYDNVYGFEEKAWNLCFNETLNKFITFYSWIPSVMENIDNIPFSFDRTTSRYIAKLGIGRNNNSFEDGIVLSENVISLEEVLETKEDKFKIGTLSISNRILPYSSHNYEITYSLEKDIYNNYLDYEIIEDELYFIIPKNEDKSINKKEILNKLFSELYYRNTNYISHPDNNEKDNKFDEEIINEIIEDLEYLSYPIFKDITGKRLQLPYNKMINPDKIVRYLNIKANISIPNDGNTHSEEYYNTKAGYESGTSLINAGYYESTIAIISDWNKLFLNTDFWKHGQAGNIDIKDNIYPTYWYGKQHPFEFEVVVVNDPSTHKIFTNLEIISNKAKPESFHYEIIGDSYDFAKDKPNMYYRQEAMKELWLNHGLDISYDKNYIYTKLKQQSKSADLIKTYYGRKNTLNEIEDLFIAKEGTKINDYRHLSGAEIVYHKNRQEYTVRVNSKAICLDNDATSLLHYNCRYLEDRWKVSINPILVCYKNEEPWKKPPYAIVNSPIPNLNTYDLKTSDGEKYDLNSWGNRHELDLKDKFIKIKIRYSGEELAVIDFLNTLYRISYA